MNWEALQHELAAFNIREEDLVEKFILGTGPGGQKINKTHSTVYLKHLPTGIEVKCQKGRSQALNRYYARKALLELVKSTQHAIKTKKEREAEKIRRQKTAPIEKNPKKAHRG